MKALETGIGCVLIGLLLIAMAALNIAFCVALALLMHWAIPAISVRAAFAVLFILTTLIGSIRGNSARTNK